MSTELSKEHPSPQTGASRQAVLILRGALILVLLFLVYYPALHGGYVWDDDHYVTANPMLSAPDGLRQKMCSRPFFTCSRCSHG